MAIGQQEGRIAQFIWQIADDVLRDVFVRSKYRDIILPMTVLRRLDAVLEPTKSKVLDMRETLERSGIENQDASLRQAADQAFYNTSAFSMADLSGRTNRARLREDFAAYLDGFSANVQEVLDNFEVRNQLPKLSKADALGPLIDKFLDPDINLGPSPRVASDGRTTLPGLDNHSVGTIFEELVRRFNEENNDEAGEHWTPRDAVDLMAQLVFRPVEGGLPSGTYLLYDGACGTGGMLTVAEQTLDRVARDTGAEVSTHLYGQEISGETYAIAKADFLLKGEGEAADNLVGGPEHSTLSNDAFPGFEFDFMLSNPPYGKSWKGDLERMGGKREIKDPRFSGTASDGQALSFVTRQNDGQMMFLANLVSKMKTSTRLGSRIAEVHNGSSLFTGDAGQGESNLRRSLFESDYVEAIVALPENMFYNTGIATFVWIITNRKASQRRGFVQLLDATSMGTPLRRNLGKKNCELTAEEIESLVREYTAFSSSSNSVILPNSAFGYWKVTVERPLRFNEADPERPYSAKEIRAMRDHLVASDTGHPIIKKIHRAGTEASPLEGRFEAKIGNSVRVVEYEPDVQLRDTEEVPLGEPGGIDAFFRREVEPYAQDAWLVRSSVKTGYEVNFARYFHKAVPLPSMSELSEELLRLEKATDGVLQEIVKGVSD